MSAPYLAMFDENSVSPAHSTATSTEDEVIWELEAPEWGGTMRVAYDGRIEPGVQWGRDGYVRLLDEDEPVVEVRFYTWVTP